MQPFLAWEIRAYADYINPQRIARQMPRGLVDIKGLLSAAPSFVASAEFQIPITIDQIRVNYGLSGHPDGSNGCTTPNAKYPYGDISQGATTNRGAAYIGASDIPVASDNTIPAAFKAAFTDVDWTGS